jgi:hypothetical protein
MTIENDRRIAHNGDQLLRGVGVISDGNGPFSLMFRADNIPRAMLLDTRFWSIEWEPKERPSL